MQQYLDALRLIKETGDGWRQTRNAETIAKFGAHMRFDMADGFPAMTTKKLAWKSVVAELLWFLEGSTDVRRLKEIAGFDLKIWDGDAAQHASKGKALFEGDLGPVYGKQWRRWTTAEKVYVGLSDHEPEQPGYIYKTIDQLADVVERIKNNPFDRRLIVSAWNVGEIDRMALPPCHLLYQFFVDSDNRLSLQMYQRSCDMFLGVPFNIASYALLLHMVAHVTGLTPGELIIVLGDAHIYREHMKQVEEQLMRTPYPLPQLWLNASVNDLFSFTMKDIVLDCYRHHSALKAPLLTQDIKR